MPAPVLSAGDYPDLTSATAEGHSKLLQVSIILDTDNTTHPPSPRAVYTMLVIVPGEGFWLNVPVSVDVPCEWFWISAV